MKNIKIDVNTNEDSANGKKLFSDKPLNPVTKVAGDITHFGILENATEAGKAAVMIVGENEFGQMMYQVTAEDFIKLAVKLLAAQKKFDQPKNNLN